MKDWVFLWREGNDEWEEHYGMDCWIVGFLCGVLIAYGLRLTYELEGKFIFALIKCEIQRKCILLCLSQNSALIYTNPASIRMLQSRAVL